MPGRFFLSRPLEEVAKHLGCKVGDLDDPPRYNVAPAQNIAVLTKPGGALQHMRWGIVPVGRVNARGRPVLETVINARSETVFEKSAFDGVRRCLVPTDGWYEWTGEKRRKTAWRIRRASGAPIVFAAIHDVWCAPNAQELHQVATLTCEPNADMRDIHHRMGVILNPSDWDTWLDADQSTAAELMRPLENGQLHIEEATDVDWDGA